MSETSAKGVLALAVIGGFGFGAWQRSIGAGLWMAVVLLIVQCVADSFDKWSRKP